MEENRLVPGTGSSDGRATGLTQWCDPEFKPCLVHFSRGNNFLCSTDTHTHIHTHTYAICIHTYIHTYTHTHTHTHTDRQAGRQTVCTIEYVPDIMLHLMYLLTHLAQKIKVCVLRAAAQKYPHRHNDYLHS